MPQYRQLARHHSVCNEVFYELQDCQAEHPFKKFLGECIDFDRRLAKCIKTNLENLRTENLKNSKQKHSLNKKVEFINEQDNLNA